MFDTIGMNGMGDYWITGLLDGWGDGDLRLPIADLGEGLAERWMTE